MLDEKKTQCEKTPAQSRERGTRRAQGKGGKRKQGSHSVRQASPALPPAGRCAVLRAALFEEVGPQLHPLAPLSPSSSVWDSVSSSAEQRGQVSESSSDPTCPSAGVTHCTSCSGGARNPWRSRLPPRGQGPALVHKRLSFTRGALI